MNASNLSRIAISFIQARWRWHRLRGANLARYQERHAQQVVQFAQQHSPFYREHWLGHDVRQWRELPTVDKQLMMQYFDTFNTRGILREAAMEIALQAERSRDFTPVLHDITVGLSSGTSGHRGLFLANSWEQAAWAGTILARTLHDIRPRRLRVAFFLRSNSNLYEQIGGLLIQFRYFDLMSPLPEAVATLNTFQPDIIVGPPSLLGFLAAEHMQGRLKIHPERLISVAEVLEPHDKEQLEAVFQAPVQQIYQCTEGLLAVSCARGSLHIQEDIVAMQFEPLVGSNAAGEGVKRVMPIVTDMWRRTQPIIRYRLNDVLQLETAPCTCGSPFRVIRAIEGRSDDICYFLSRRGGTRPFFPDTIRRMVLLASPDITDYSVVQEQPGQLHIYLSVPSASPFSTIKQAVLESVNETIRQYDCCPAIIDIEQGLPPLEAGIKRRRVRRVQ